MESQSTLLLATAELEKLYHIGITSVAQAKRFKCAICWSKMNGIPLSERGEYLLECCRALCCSEGNRRRFEEVVGRLNSSTGASDAVGNGTTGI